LLDPVHGYSVKGTYHFLTMVDELLDRGFFDNIRHKHVPLRFVHGYSVKGTYHFLTMVDELLDRGLFDNIWHKHVPVRFHYLLGDFYPTDF